MLSEHDKLGNHKVEGKGPVDLDIELSGIILACFFENVKGSLRKSRKFSNSRYRDHAMRREDPIEDEKTPCGHGPVGLCHRIKQGGSDRSYLSFFAWPYNTHI